MIIIIICYVCIMHPQLHVQQFYLDHYDFLFHWLISQLNNQADVHDILQETFLSLLEQDVSLDYIVQPRAFLLTIAKRKMYALWRRRNVEQAYLRKQIDQEFYLEHGIEQLVLLQDALQRIERILEGLPDKVKQAFLLRKIEQLAHIEIAEKLSLSLATIERYIRQATLQCALKLSLED